MAIHYSMSCLPRTQDDILNFALWNGYPDLAPAMMLSNTAVESGSLAVEYRQSHNHHLISHYKLGLGTPSK